MSPSLSREHEKLLPALLSLDCMSMSLGSFQLREAVRDVINREFNGEM